MLEFGKRYTWDEIVEAYPNKYAIVTDIEDGKDRPVESAILLDVSDFNEMDSKVLKFTERGIKCSWFWTKGYIQEGVILYTILG